MHVPEVIRHEHRQRLSHQFRARIAEDFFGRAIHEEPLVPNFRDPRARRRLTEGLVITIEPVIAAGSGRTRKEKDGWTFRTEDGSLAAHYEHTVVITRGEPVLLTAT